jgi:lipopolysaccharide transport system permease protein
MIDQRSEKPKITINPELSSRAPRAGITQVVWLERNVLLATTLVDIRTRFAGTLFGLAWTVLFPILFLGLYAVVYIMIFRVRAAGYDTVEYILLIFCGLIPFIGFADALGAGVSSVVSNKALIRNTIFPIELIPVKVVLTSSVTMVVGLCVLLCVLWSRGIAHYTQLLIPVILVLQLIFTAGLICLLSAVNVFVPDLGHTISIVILLLMLISPIGYTEEMVPPELRAFMLPNPLYYLIMLYRDAAFLGVIRPSLLASFSLITLVSWTVGTTVFRRLKPLFADYV